MSLKHFVKVNQVTNLSDARYCAGMMVDQIGFNLNPQEPEYITPQKFKEITSWISGVAKVGEFGNMNIEQISTAVIDYNLDYIQVNFVSNFTPFKDLSLPLFLILDAKVNLIENLEIAKSFKSSIKYIGIENESGLLSSEIELIERSLEAYLDDFLFVKGFDIHVSTVTNLNTIWHGLMLDGSQEDKPGFKDYGVLMDVLESIEY